jgi:hypothetical protein
MYKFIINVHLSEQNILIIEKFCFIINYLFNNFYHYS